MNQNLQQNKSNYVQNRAPLQRTPFIELPLGSVEPGGWLRDQLEIQAEGFTGKLPDYWDDLGPDSGWLGGPGESWERGPYYLDGLVPLAYLLKDQILIQKVENWIEWTLASQREDGQFGPESNDDWWSRMVMMKVLIQYEEATGDRRVVPFLTKYLQYQMTNIDKRPLKEWAEARGAENVLVIYWLFNRTGDEFLLELAAIIQEQTIDWTEIFTNFPYWRYQTQFDHRIHVVNVLMALKEPALRYLLTGLNLHKDAPIKGINNLMTYHGQLHGLCSGDEWLAGTHPSQGVELCGVVEYMFTLENLIRIYGNGMYGDILEQVSFNALPATISPDWTSRQYVQQVNQVECSQKRRNWTENRDDANMFGLEPNFGCCTANMHQGWPKFATRLWMATEDNGLAAISYAPCNIRAVVADTVNTNLHVETLYPFDESVSIQINLEKKAAFPIKLRIPAWCHNPVIKINNIDQTPEVESGFMTVEREWSNGDKIHLNLQMEVRCEPRANNAVGVFRGPLLFALPIGEKWYKRYGNMPFASWEVYPEESTPWNYGLQIDSKSPENSIQVKKRSMNRQPYLAKDAPVTLTVSGRKIPGWKLEMNSAGNLPLSPVRSEEPLEQLELVPYGSARLRITEFPVLQEL